MGQVTEDVNEQITYQGTADTNKADEAQKMQK